MKRKNKRRNNIVKLILLIGCLFMFFKDLYILAIYPFISGETSSLTLFGLITFILNYLIISIIVEDFVYQIKSVSINGKSRHTK